MSNFSLEDFISENREWSRRVFGEGKRTIGVTEHIKGEVEEVRQNPDDLEEWVDIVFLALDGAWRAGYEPHEIVEMLEAKQRKNFERIWPPPPPQNEPSFHIESEE